MPSPFPGMDPYLEGGFWPDFHAGLAIEIQRALAPQIRPKYVARVEMTLIGGLPEERGSGVMRPDVEVVELPGRRQSSPSAGTATLTPAMTIPYERDLPYRQRSVVIRLADANRVVTSIEILSPANKQPENFRALMDKRRRLREGGAHLLDIDLLRAGRRVINAAELPELDYLVSLLREDSQLMEFWPVSLQGPLPVVPVPLLAPDPDAVLDLGAAFREHYDAAAYDVDLNYRRPVPPPLLSPENDTWVRVLLDAYLAPATA